MPELRPFGRADVPAAGRLLGRAFAENPANLAALGHFDPARRARAVESLNRGFAATAVDHWTPEALFAGDRMLGVMIALGPGAYPPRLRVKLGALRGALAIGLRGVRSYAALDAHMQRLHPHEPHHYLFILGVDPPEQGRGHGRTLLEHLNARADADRLPCYLETDRETSVRLYASVGYRVVSDERLPAVRGLRMWTMRRDPR